MIFCGQVWRLQKTLFIASGLTRLRFRELSPDEKKPDYAAFEDSKSVADDANGADWPKSEGRRSDGKIIDDDAPDDVMTAVSQNTQK